MNPWDDIYNAPFFALYKDGTEMSLRRVPLQTPFVVVKTGERYLERTDDFRGYNVDGSEQLLEEGVRVVIDDRKV